MPESYNAGGYDWLATWRRMYDQERAQAEDATLPDFVRTADCWSGQASRFAAAAQRVPQPDSFMRLLLPRLRPTDRLLDIGAGAGRYEPLLAGVVAEVLALEPSPAMREQLERRLEEQQIANVRVLAEGWPQEPHAELPPCDVVIAAHVLYGVRDIAPFLQRMNAVARRSCLLLLAFRHPSSVVSPFWERVYGTPRLPLPGALECLSALYQLGITAHMTPVPISSRIRYADEHEALDDLRWRLRTPAQPSYDRIIQTAIADLLDRADDGSLTPRNQPTDAAVIWWDTSASAEEKL